MVSVCSVSYIGLGPNLASLVALSLTIPGDGVRSLPCIRDLVVWTHIGLGLAFESWVGARSHHPWGWHGVSLALNKSGPHVSKQSWVLCCIIPGDGIVNVSHLESGLA